jgi:NAD(P)-dependent dehydrogenase (short-subunit alcohol dehydrogenase family)
VALEHPDIWGGVIDLPPGDGRASAEALAREWLAGGGEDQVAVRSSGRYVPRLVPASEDRERRAASPGARSLHADGTYLVTGGAGALGLHVARWLAAHGARRLVLASRRGAADAGASAAIEDLAKADVDVSVVAADVSSPGDVDALFGAIAASGAPLRGVVHAAGVDTIVPLHAMTDDDVRSALAAKVEGAWLLHERTLDLDLDLFVCFSSIAAVLGSQGRAHYGAANASLDALAAERRRLGLPATSVNWGPWTGGGMATAEHLQQLERIGNHGLNPEDALRALDAAVSGGMAQVVAADIDWDPFRPVYEARRVRPLLAEIQDTGRHVPSDGTREITPGVMGDADTRVAPWVAALQALPPAGREAALAGLLRREVAGTLGFDDPDSVPLDRSLYDLGVDSLLMAERVARLKAQVGFSCSALVFDHPDVQSLAATLVERLVPGGGPDRSPPRSDDGPADTAEADLSWRPFMRSHCVRRLSTWSCVRWIAISCMRTVASF